MNSIRRLWKCKGVVSDDAMLNIIAFDIFASAELGLIITSIPTRYIPFRNYSYRFYSYNDFVFSTISFAISLCILFSHIAFCYFSCPLQKFILFLMLYFCNTICCYKWIYCRGAFAYTSIPLFLQVWHANISVRSLQYRVITINGMTPRYYRQ